MIKRSVAFLVFLEIVLLLTGCGVSQTEYDALQARLNQAQQEYDELKQAYDELAEGAEGWLKLSEEERAAKLAQAEADRIAAEEAEKKAKAEQEAAAEQAAREAEEEARKGYDTGITFDHLARNPDDYTGKKVKLTGHVVQVVEYEQETQIRLATKKTNYGKTGYEHSFEDVVYLYVDASNITSRILEDDLVTIYGTSRGLYTYTSTTDLRITLPLIEVEQYDILNVE